MSYANFQRTILLLKMLNIRALKYIINRVILAVFFRNMELDTLIIITHPQAYCIILTYPAKEKSRFIIVCLNTCLTATYITQDKLVYFWCTLFSFNSGILYNFAGVISNIIRLQFTIHSFQYDEDI